MKRKLIFVGAMLVVSSTIFAQQENESTIQEVTIASKAPQAAYKAGKNVQLITKKDLEKFKGQNLNEILNQVSGIQISGNFNNPQEPKSLKINGGKSANVLILVDGIPLKDVTANDYTVSDLRLFAAENIESIEILNGASSVLYGSNATVSVINIKTKNTAEKPLQLNIGARAGSFDTYAQSFSAGLKKGNHYFQLKGLNEKSRGISSAAGENFEKDGFEKQNIGGSYTYRQEKWLTTFDGNYTNHLFQYDLGAFADSEDRNKDYQFYLSNTSKYFYDKGEFSLLSRYSKNRRLSQTKMNEEYNDSFSYTGEQVYIELNNHHQFAENFKLTSGLVYEKQNLGNRAVPYGSTEMEDVLINKETYSTSYEAFTLAQSHYKAFHLDTGLRFSHHSKYGNHLVYSINPYYLKEMETLYWKLGISHATAFISPTLYQNFGSLPYTLPNADLKPETNSTQDINFEIGKKDRSLLFSTSFFQRQEKDVFTYVNFPDFTGQFQNVEENEVKGLEVGVRYKINEMVNFGGNFGFVEKDKEATMLRQPKQRVNSYIEILPFKTTRVNFSHQFVSKRNDAYYDSSAFSIKNVVVDSYNLFNLNINQKITQKLESYLNIGNLFNTSYTDVIGYNTRPRNFTFGVNYNF
ncbi:TonB-dependent receptor plug domain-containing protein [Chryseobacterium sp.]|uniref:TonB-dependent receptor plug domain-containing protein n=1 Tax=Chryseobacterium sp. TaxID=1871047 RepID=UPI0011C9A66F|nr:TonB-dependent receptor plug domain-containing protein [Chryseobacterium sp.]TXF74893.1 TonB-dependent receptor [Chryseobacterium sp.]